MYFLLARKEDDCCNVGRVSRSLVGLWERLGWRRRWRQVRKTTQTLGTRQDTRLSVRAATGLSHQLPGGRPVSTGTGFPVLNGSNFIYLYVHATGSWREWAISRSPVAWLMNYLLTSELYSTLLCARHRQLEGMSRLSLTCGVAHELSSN